MSFKPTISPVSICNEALALLPEGPITSLTQPSLAARECTRFYKVVVGELLEQHHWGLATKRGALAAIANDRSREWSYAYSKPADMAYPVAAMDESGLNYTGFRALNGLFLASTGERLLTMAGNTIYSNVQGATLEYTSFDIIEQDFSLMFRKAVVLELAYRLSFPITKDDKRSRALQAEAEGWRQRAIANAMNASQPTYGNGMTESEIVRFGPSGGNDFYGSGYALDPVALPANTGT